MTFLADKNEIPLGISLVGSKALWKVYLLTREFVNKIHFSRDLLFLVFMCVLNTLENLLFDVVCFFFAAHIRVLFNEKKEINGNLYRHYGFFSLGRIEENGLSNSPNDQRLLAKMAFITCTYFIHSIYCFIS
jgi:hypothetical protein